MTTESTKWGCCKSCINPCASVLAYPFPQVTQSREAYESCWALNSWAHHCRYVTSLFWCRGITISSFDDVTFYCSTKGLQFTIWNILPKRKMVTHESTSALVHKAELSSHLSEFKEPRNLTARVLLEIEAYGCKKRLVKTLYLPLPLH